jgi:hypothetical protein
MGYSDSENLTVIRGNNPLVGYSASKTSRGRGGGYPVPPTPMGNQFSLFPENSEEKGFLERIEIYESNPLVSYLQCKS